MKKILLVDDNRVHRKMYAAFLTPVEKLATIIQAENGEEAIIIAFAERPDVILMDYQMPGINGEEAAKKIKENPSTSSIPIIMLTAEADETKIDKGLFHSFLLKQNAPKELAHIVMLALGGR